MTGYKIKFNGVDRLYDAFSWRLTRRAKAVWKSGDMLQGKYLKQLESEVAKKYKRKYAIGVGSATDGLYFAMQAVGVNSQSTVLWNIEFIFNSELGFSSISFYVEA